MRGNKFITMYDTNENYEVYKVQSGSSDVRSLIENRIRKEGEEKRTITKAVLNDSLYVEKEKEKKFIDKVKSTVEVITLLCIFFIIVIGIANDGLLGFFHGLLIGIVVLVVVVSVLFVMGIFYDEMEKKSDSLEKEIDVRVKEIDDEINNRIKSELTQYDTDVKETYKKIWANLSNIEPMVNYSVEMFKRMISHANSDSSKKFIECNFTYIVTTNEIKYLYDSSYTNPRDDFNFEKQRFRNFKYKYECEGLALALAQAVSNRMNTLYPPNTMNITIKNEDAKVTIRFKAPNENFIVARDIY